VPIRQQDFEQTPLALSALNHARSFDESCAGKVLQIDRRNGRSNVWSPPAAGRRYHSASYAVISSPRSS
jgi:hypothetical protein